jgi:hypothetical protein
VVALPVFFGLLLSFGMSTPLYASPDEPHQVIKAAAVVRGQWGEKVVEVPRFIADAPAETCFAFQGDQSAACQEFLDIGDTSATRVDSPFSTYNPFYYLIVGWPSLLGDDVSVVYGMRIASSALVAVLLALGFSVLRASSRTLWPSIAFAATVTPITLFLGGAVNASSLEVASASLAWAGLGSAFTAYQRGAPAMEQRLTAIAGTLGLTALMPTRILSPLWAFLILVLCLLAARMNAADIWGFVRRRTNVILVAIIAVWAVVSLVWIVTNPTVTTTAVDSAESGLDEVFKGIFIDYPNLALPSAFGVLGWLDTWVSWAPYVILMTWTALAALVFARVPSRRARGSIVAVVVLGILLPAVLEGVLWSGQGWQGRYTLPLLVGIPILSGLALSSVADGSDQWRLSRGGRWIPWAIAGTTVLAFALNLHRYLIGFNDSWDAASFEWNPPLGWITWSAIAVAAATALAILALWPSMRASRASAGALTDRAADRG